MFIITSMISRACQTAACPGFDRVFKSASILWRRGVSACGPNLSVPHFNFNDIQGTRRRTVKNISRGDVECAFMTRAFQSLMVTRVINRTTQVCTLLPVSVISAAGCANEDRGISLGRITKIQTAVKRESFSACDVLSGQ